MNDKAQIKRLRTQSLLKELIGEALANLDDPMLNSLLVNDVDCKKGRYDAFIYLDKMGLTKDEQNLVLSKLRKVSKVLQAHCLGALGMYRCPNFHFMFDDSLDKINRIEELFKQINKERQ